MFEGFAVTEIDTGEARIRVRHGGSGPPLLLLHGNPQTHVMWHRIAPRLARDFTVVAPDLRGYGDSSKPPTTPDHEPYSKRAMARDQVAVMRQLGFERFAVVGHDRGGRVAYRLALDHPQHVSKLATLDILPGSLASVWGGRAARAREWSVDRQSKSNRLKVRPLARAESMSTRTPVAAGRTRRDGRNHGGCCASARDHA